MVDVKASGGIRHGRSGFGLAEAEEAEGGCGVGEGVERNRVGERGRVLGLVSRNIDGGYGVYPVRG